jgi:hypothetical protein
VVQGKANRFLRIGEHATQAVDLLSQIELPLSRGFEFFIDGFSGILIQVGRFDLILDQVNVGAANAGLHDGIKAFVDDSGQATEFLADRFRFPHKRGQDAVLRTLPIEEVVTVDLRIRLEFPVDAPVALLHTARVPGHVEVEDTSRNRPYDLCCSRSRDGCNNGFVATTGLYGLVAYTVSRRVKEFGIRVART